MGPNRSQVSSYKSQVTTGHRLQVTNDKLQVTGARGKSTAISFWLDRLRRGTLRPFLWHPSPPPGYRQPP